MLKSFIVTIDADRLADSDPDCEYQPIERSIRLALMGRDYPKGRGIVSIEQTHVIPSTREKMGM